MKIRYSFVTNSSSSSFLISKTDVDLDFLVNTIIKDLYIALNEDWNDCSKEELEQEYKNMDVLNNDDTSIAVSEYPESDEYDHHGNQIPIEGYYEISNNCYIRFDWDIVEKIISGKYDLDWKYGYCD